MRLFTFFFTIFIKLTKKKGIGGLDQGWKALGDFKSEVRPRVYCFVFFYQHNTSCFFLLCDFLLVLDLSQILFILGEIKARMVVGIAFKAKNGHSINKRPYLYTYIVDY